MKSHIFLLLVTLGNALVINWEILRTDNNAQKTLTTALPFESWLKEQERISFDRILQNIGGYGDFKQNVSVGAVVASPSDTRPNYFFQWTRDSAVTVLSLVHRLDDMEFGEGSDTLAKLVEAYLENQYHLQRLDNPSGTFADLSGLGEPKFMMNGEPFTENWGRPQRDGPGLRVLTSLSYLNLLSKHERSLDSSFFAQDGEDPFRFVYDNIVKPDLQYIVKYWPAVGFDLWEEVNSLHLFTSLTQLKALKMGMQYAEQFQDDDFLVTLTSTFSALNVFIRAESGYKTGNYPFLIETPSLLFTGKRSGLDIASILAVLQSHDVDDLSDAMDIPFTVDDPIVLNTLTALVNDMKYRYPLNRHSSLTKGFALGRYPEDIYDGYGTSEGNPWFIATATASELVYKLIYKLYKHEQALYIPVDQKRFYEPFVEYEITEDVIIPFGSAEFRAISDELIKYADSFMDVIREHVDSNGHMSEQFNRYSGYMEGAEDLTWSYSSCWSSMRWRNKAVSFMED